MKIIYEWLKRGRHAFLRRVELFSQEDLAKKPEIHRDTAKLPALPIHGSFAAAHQRQIDARNKRRK